MLNPLSTFGQYTSCEFIRKPISNAIGLNKIETLNRLFTTNYKTNSVDFDKLLENLSLTMENDMVCADLSDYQMILLFTNELRVYHKLECNNT